MKKTKALMRTIIYLDNFAVNNIVLFDKTFGAGKGVEDLTTKEWLKLYDMAKEADRKEFEHALKTT